MNITMENRCETTVTREMVAQVKENMPPAQQIYDLADFFKVFGDSTRMGILFALFERELCVCDIAEVMNMTQSAISHQLRVLKHTKLVKNRKESRTVYYSLADDHIKTIIHQSFAHVIGECGNE